MFKCSIPRFSLAMVWGYQGLWCKLLGRAPRHLAIVQDALGGSAHLGLAAIGAAECALAVWVLSGRRPVAAAASQTALLAAMNAGGILWAPREIPDIPGMLLANFAFVVLAWEVAYANR